MVKSQGGCECNPCFVSFLTSFSLSEMKESLHESINEWEILAFHDTTHQRRPQTLFFVGCGLGHFLRHALHVACASFSPIITSLFNVYINHMFFKSDVLNADFDSFAPLYFNI